MMSNKQLIDKVLRLPRAERARVVEKILLSLEEPTELVVDAWASELEQRSREVAEGRVKTLDWDSVRSDIQKELERRREDKPTS